MNNTQIPEVIIGLSAVIVSIHDEEPKVFIVRGAEHALSGGIAPTNEDGDALPFGPFDPEKHPTLEKGLIRWVKNQTPFVPKYVEQLYTFSNKAKYLGKHQGQFRKVLSIGYIALTTEEAAHSDDVFFGDWYSYFPWEDWRQGRPRILDDLIFPALKRWIKAGESTEEKLQREQRVDACFGEEWDEERVLERFELLYSARLVYEAIRDMNLKIDYPLIPGRSMLYDHRRILATAIARLRGKLKYRPVIFDLMPEEFTLLQLQRAVEAIRGQELHKQNFRRYVEGSGMIEQLKGKKSQVSGGRPASLYRFKTTQN